jgi:uncharacterized protein YgiM (DUF1202 family)
MMKKSLILILLVLVACLLIIVSLMDSARSEEKYILCKPKTEINVRFSPKWDGQVIGHLYFGDSVELDGKVRNGFAHVIGLGFEETEGWIYKGLLVDTPPIAFQGKDRIISSGKVAARQYIGGKRNKWLRSGREVIVYAISQDWSITDQGYVQTKYLSVNYQIP